MTALFKGEEIDLSDREIDDAARMSDSQVNAKYAKGEVRIVTEQARYPLTNIPVMLASGNYEINPEFQRRHRWDDEKRSRLIESFIMNVPVPPIFLYEDRFSHYQVMDGLQRLTAINHFYSDQFKLVGLTEWSELNGRHYSNLPEQVRRGIDRRYLSSIILLQETAKREIEAQQLKQLVFERINSGGVQLEPQESRNAVYPGPLNDLCIELSKNPYLCRTWNIPEPSRSELEGGRPSSLRLNNELFSKMTDVELVLRFFAYRQRLANHRGALKTYLDGYLARGNRFSAGTLDELAELFERTMETVYELFGEKAFWLFRLRNDKWGWYQRPTTVVYDPLMYVVSQRLDRRENLLRRAPELRKQIELFYVEKYNLFEGRYTNLSNVKDRNELLSAFFDEHSAA
jgi:hypothetical protein